jgi:hypothetical protein
MLKRSDRLPAEFFLNPIPIQDLFYQSSISFARQFQEPIAFPTYYEGEKSDIVPLENIRHTLLFFIVADNDLVCPLRRVQKDVKNIQAWHKLFRVMDYSHLDFIFKPSELERQLHESLTTDLASRQMNESLVER